MATCSNMADPVLLFQLPEMDVRLEKKGEHPSVGEIINTAN